MGKAPRKRSIRPGQIQAIAESIARGYAEFGIKMGAQGLARDVELQLWLGYLKIHPHHLEECRLWAERVQPLMHGGPYEYPSEYKPPVGRYGRRRASKA